MEALLSPPSPGDNVEGSLLLFVDALYMDIVAALSFKGFELCEETQLNDPFL